MKTPPFLPILKMPTTDRRTLRKAEVCRFQGQKFVFTFQVGEQKYKILQIVFGRDGSLYVTLPYFDTKKGIVSRCSISPLVMETKVTPQTGGMVTSLPIKYSHRPDGDAHFSQTGKVLTRIRKKSVPLALAEGHIFTLYVQGLDHFEQANNAKDSKPPKLSRTVLNFDLSPSLFKSQTYKLLGHWYRAQSITHRCVQPHGTSFGPNRLGFYPMANT